MTLPFPDEAGIVAAALRDPYIGDAFRALPPMAEWSAGPPAGVIFSPWHFRADNPGFALPFDPAACLWAPAPIDIPVQPRSDKHGWYRRGVAKYARRLRAGEALPPVCFVHDAGHGWRLLDGNHRYEAHVLVGRPTIPACFALRAAARPRADHILPRAPERAP